MGIQYNCGLSFEAVRMPYLDINLFGEFRVQRDGEPVKSEEWDRQKARSLLKLLLTRPGHIFSRDEIIEALWPGTPPMSAERSLWVTVSLLRRALEPDLERGSDSRYVIQRRPGYFFDGQADCRVDAWEFDKRSKKAEAAEKARKLDEAIEQYRSALEIVGGEFLAEEPYEDWTMEVREEWRSRHLAALSGLAECLAQKGRYTEAIEACRRALALERYSEELCRRLMLYNYCAGEQALALKAYQDHARRLKEELGVNPPLELT
ncbi:MAG: winged helix-turn-helix domain-containing protein, partial [Actinobacteria bacterium]|nr:winged helix-turn-helix domain-containing protein [Actinomycetota bacterium]